uniref:C-type lectin domain-containing protein n=1 Tax=Syphacia muris TaxID=451379 RepID=A0A0N5AEX6_9BILA
MTVEPAESSCTCNGIEVLLDDDITHCYQVESLSTANWISADQRCASLGGHLAHFSSLQTYNRILSLLPKLSGENLLLGYSVANVDLQAVAKLCQGNSFLEILEDDLRKQLFVGEADNTTRCTFLNLNDKKLHYGSCEQFNSILCDRPLEKPDYCSIMVNCTVPVVGSTTTELPVTIDSTYFQTTTTTANSILNSDVTLTTRIGLPIINNGNNDNFENNESDESNELSDHVSSDVIVTAPLQNTATPIPFKNNESNSVWLETDCSLTQVCEDIKLWRWCLPWWIFLILGLLLLLSLLCCLSWMMHCFCCRICIRRCQVPAAGKKLNTNQETQTSDVFDDFSETKLKPETDSGYYAENDSITKDYIPMPFPTATAPEAGLIINDDGPTNEVFVEGHVAAVLVGSSDCGLPNQNGQRNADDGKIDRRNDGDEYCSKRPNNNFNSHDSVDDESSPSYKSDSESPRSELLLLTNSKIVLPDESRQKDAVKPKAKKKKRLRTPEVSKADKETPFTDSDMSKVSRHFTPPPFQNASSDESSATPKKSLPKNNRPKSEENEERRSRAISKAMLNNANGANTLQGSLMPGDVKIKGPNGANGGIVGTGTTSASPMRWMQWSHTSKNFTEYPRAFLSNDV